MKKIKTISLLTTLGLTLGGCSLANINLGGELEALNVETKTLAFQATTGMTLIRDLNAPLVVSPMSDITTESQSEQTSVEEDLSEEVESEPVTEFSVPIATLDVLFSNGHDFNVEQKESDRAEYSNLDVISFSVLDQQEIAYSLYYNVEGLLDDETSEDDGDNEETSIVETSIEEETMSEEVNEDSVVTPSLTIEKHDGNGNQNQHHDDDEDDDDENEEDEEDDDRPGHHGDNGQNGEGGRPGHSDGHQGHTHDDEDDREGPHGNQNHPGQGHGRDKVRITGIAVFGEEEYRFMSMTEVDEDSDEQEIEMKFMLFKDELNFITIKQEVEIEGTEGESDYSYEEEFKYMVVEQGVKTRQFKLEIEEEDGLKELEVKIDGLKYEVEYEFIDDKIFIHIDTNGHGEFVYEKIITIDIETEITTIEYVLQ